MIKSVAAAGALLLLAACTASNPARVVTVTVDPPAPSPVTSAPPSTPTAPVSSAASPTHLTKLAGTCDDLPAVDVSRALGRASLGGKDMFVVGQPEKDIGRLAYLNCRYGITGSGPAAPPKVEIGVSLYAQPSDAARRVSATVDDYTAHGATPTAAKVAGETASLLTGGSGAGYDVPLLVLADGQRTVAVSIAPALVRGTKLTSAAVTLARLALEDTGP